MENKFVVGHIGRIFPAKNHPYLLEVFKEFLQKNENSVLLLVGDGPSRKEIENKAQSLGVSEKVIFTGVRSDVNEILQAMDCFVFPSVYEGLPVTVIEAQASGLPCLISDTITDEVCITDLVNKLSIKESPGIWAEEIIKKCMDFKRQSTIKEIVQAGYDVENTAHWVEEFYLNCIAS